MSSIGTALARLHSTTLIHGDLTTSNMMIRLTPGKSESYEVVSPSLLASSLYIPISYPMRPGSFRLCYSFMNEGLNAHEIRF